MKHRHLCSRSLQQVALGAALLLAGAIAANYWRMVYYVGPPRGNGITFTFAYAGGALRFGWDYTYIPRYEDMFGPPKVSGKWTLASNQAGLRDFRDNARPRLIRGTVSGSLTTGGCILVPLWMLLIVLMGGIGAIETYHRRRPLPGHCPRCRYNLTGNTTGVCPECGNRVSAVKSNLAKNQIPPG